MKGEGLTFPWVPRHDETVVVCVHEHIERRVSHLLGESLSVEVCGEGEAGEFGPEGRCEAVADGLP